MAELFADTFASVFVRDVPVDPASYQVFNGVMPDTGISVGGVCDLRGIWIATQWCDLTRCILEF